VLTPHSLTLSPHGRGDYRDAILVHQVHPVKLAFDISASAISNVLLWRHRLGAGLVSRYLLPVVGSALVLGFADLEGLRSTPRGRYVLEHMPPASTALRLGGDTLMAAGAWRRKPSWLLAGALIVAAGWSHGAFFDPISTDR
jgi:hypothetical protein